MARNPPLKSPRGYKSLPLNSNDSVFEQKSNFHLSQCFPKLFSALHSPRFVPNNTLRPKILRLVTFLLLEIGFLAFGLFCLLKPIPLPLSNDEATLRLAKAFITAITVVWHTLAAFAAQDLTACVFSAECMTQYCLTGKLKPGETDRVSIITSGLFSRIKHFMSVTATPQYRLGFAAAVIVMALGPIGPAVLTIGSISVESLVGIQLSKLDRIFIHGDVTGANQASRRAELALRMETSENYTFGYDALDERVLIPWPQPELKSQEDVVIYMTDVLTYDFNCSWSSLNEVTDWLDNLSIFNLMELNGKIWLLSPSEYTFTLFNSLTSTGANNMITSLIGLLNESPLSGFLFIEPANGHGNFTLENLPFTNGSFNGDDSNFRGSVLLCDPRYQIHSWKVLLEKGTLRIYSLASEVLPRVGNIPIGAANATFSQALMVATAATMDFDPLGMLVSDHSISLFLDSQYAILPLEVINSNMNTYMQSAAKAYLGGLDFQSGTSSSAQSSRNNWIAGNATRIHQTPALAASKPFLIAFAVVVATSGVLLSSLMIMMPHNDMQFFDLHNFTVRIT